MAAVCGTVRSRAESQGMRGANGRGWPCDIELAIHRDPPAPLPSLKGNEMATNRDIVDIVSEGIHAELQRAKAEIILKLEKQILLELHERIGGIVLATEHFYNVRRQGGDVIITLIDKAKNK